MKYLKQLSLLVMFAMTFTACNDDDPVIVDPFVVAFENLSTNLTTITDESTVNLSYSETTTTTGSFTVNVSETNAVYGVDYTTTPAAVNGRLNLPITSGEDGTSFVFNKINPTIDEEALIQFEITDIQYNDAGTIQGNSSFQFNNSASLGGSLLGEVGGPNQPNQVFVDLSNNKVTTSRRDSWDLGFYGGSDFRVAINGSLFMMAAALSGNDIDAVTSASPEVTGLQSAMNIGQVGAQAFADDVTGDINGTAIGEVSATDADNPVYLINLGFEVGTSSPDVGSVDVDGPARGWMKIRVLRSGDGYVLQYADLDATSHQEVTITKNSAFNFSHFSLITGQEVTVQPEKAKWDLGFTVFTNVISFGGPLGAYGFSDFSIHNGIGGSEAYSLDGTTVTYDDFTMAHVQEMNLTPDQNIPGSSWRSVFSGTVTPDVFYILKDPNGNTYKIRFTALTNANGERGYPEFEYELLQ